MKNFISVLLLFFLIASNTSCTLILMPSKQNVNVKTDSNDSKVFIDNKEQIGEGKSFSTKITKTGSKQLTLKTPGFKDQHFVIKPEKRSPLFYPLMTLDFPFLFFGYGYFVTDKPKNFEYAKTIEIKNEIRYENRKEKEKFISISAIKLNISDIEKDFNVFYLTEKDDIDSEILKLKNKKTIETKKDANKKNNKKEIKYLKPKQNGVKTEDTNLTEGINETLKKTGFIDTINTIFLDNNNSVVIQGEIYEIDEFNFASINCEYKKIGVNVKWNILNTYNEIIDSVKIYSLSDPFVSSNYTNNFDYQPIITDAIEKSFNLLRNNSKYRENAEITSDFDTKDEILTIQKPKNLVKELSEASDASVIIKRNDNGHGSGFAISNDGYILTNYHVIAGKSATKTEEIKVILSDGTELEAQIVRFNKARDIALIKVEHSFNKAFLLKTEKEFQNLLQVYTIGTPKSIELGQSISAGLISNERKANKNNVLQLSMSINGGNSGGPLFDSKGILHGVIQAKLVGFATEGVGFAIPSYLISNYLNIKYSK